MWMEASSWDGRSDRPLWSGGIDRDVEELPDVFCVIWWGNNPFSGLLVKRSEASSC